MSNIIFQPADPTIADETIQRVREVLGRRHRFDPLDKDAIWIWDTGMFDRSVFYFFLAFNIFMGLIGSFTLTVGGIGVANIMYIVVQERIKEIGIRRAVGATRRHILTQFFAESCLIILLGSSVGFLIAVGITEAMRFIPRISSERQRYLSRWPWRPPWCWPSLRSLRGSSRPAGRRM